MLLEKWEQGVENQGKREAILKELNAPIQAHRIRITGNAKLWTYGFKATTHVAQLNGNNLELI